MVGMFQDLCQFQPTASFHLKFLFISMLMLISGSSSVLLLPAQIITYGEQFQICVRSFEVVFRS